MNIFLDDTRNPEDVTWVKLPELGPGESWTIVRSVKEFIEVLELCDRTHMKIARVCFDHDLADEHYGDQHMNEGTGQEAATALVELLVRRDWDLPQYAIHTMNPIGAKKIEAIIINDYVCQLDWSKYESSMPLEPVKKKVVKPIREKGLSTTKGRKKSTK